MLMRITAHLFIVLTCMSMMLTSDAQISRRTYIKVINNTPFDITIARFNAPSDVEHSPSQVKVIASGHVVEKAAFFQRNIGVKKGKTYEFSLTLQLPKDLGLPSDGRVFLNQKMVGKTIDSDMFLSATVAGNSITWYPADRKSRSLKISKDNHTFIISYESYYAGPGTDDVWYTIDYIDESMYSVIPVGDNGINVFVYNVAGLTALPRFQLGQRTRAEIIPQEIKNIYDAVIICEAYEKDTREPLLESFKKVGYKYVSSVVGLKEANKLGSGVAIGIGALAGPLASKVSSGLTKDIRTGGVVIVSRWPIVADKYTIFEARANIDKNANKGAIHVAINKNGKKYHLIGMHTNARWEQNDGSDVIRQKQFKQVYDFIKSENIPANEPVIIGGDLNVNMYDKDEYEMMLKTLNATQPPLDGPYKYTWDPRVNKLDPQQNLNITELLDYALYSNEHRKPTKSFNRILLFKAHQDWMPKVSMQERVALKDRTTLFDLSDHFPIYGHFVFEGY